MNAELVHVGGFADRDLRGIDRWETFTPVFGSLTVVGATTYVGRYRLVGKKCEFQVSFKAATSIASVAGTDYLTLPVQKLDATGTLVPIGVAGMAVMTNDTTNVAVGVCHIKTSTNRCYLPAQVASGNTFNIAGWYEVA